MSDCWDFYFLRVDGDPASIFVDLGISKKAPVRSHPTMGYLRVLMLRPREDGLSSQDEFDDLVALEDRVTAKVIQNGAALFIGRNTSSGNRDFYFYTADPTDFEKAAKAAMGEFPAYEFETGTRADQEWRTYFDFLYPSETDFQRIMNRRVCQQLEKNGDNASNERKIDHVALLPNLKTQAAFACYVQAEGFAVESGPGEPNADGQFIVEFYRIDQPARIDEIVVPLFRKVTYLLGKYDFCLCITYHLTECRRMSLKVI
jgi:hypothetical protein